MELNLPRDRYEVRIGPGLLAELGPLVRGVAPHARAALLADAAVLDPFGRTAEASLRAAGYEVVLEASPTAESRKSLDTAARLYAALVEARMERRSPVVALGGGVNGDTVGFVASTYLRGVPFIQCPTTLLAMVDASVGGKVGVNLPQGKNLVGSFYQPARVVIDTDTLRTLPPRELRCGLAECVKHGVIRDPALFAWIESHLDDVLRLEPSAVVELVAWNVRIKAAVVMADEKETGERAHLNFGHTFAHAIEATVGYRDGGAGYAHGEAVSLGMVAATRLAADTGRCPPDLLPRLEGLLTRIGLPVRAADLPPADELLAAMRLDKKVADGRLRLVLPDRLGAVAVVAGVPDETTRAAWAYLRG